MKKKSSENISAGLNKMSSSQIRELMPIKKLKEIGRICGYDGTRNASVWSDSADKLRKSCPYEVWKAIGRAAQSHIPCSKCKRQTTLMDSEVVPGDKAGRICSTCYERAKVWPCEKCHSLNAEWEITELVGQRLCNLCKGETHECPDCGMSMSIGAQHTCQ